MSLSVSVDKGLRVEKAESPPGRNYFGGVYAQIVAIVKVAHGSLPLTGRSNFHLLSHDL